MRTFPTYSAAALQKLLAHPPSWVTVEVAAEIRAALVWRRDNPSPWGGGGRSKNMARRQGPATPPPGDAY